MSVLAQGNSTSRGVEEDIIVPLLARLTTITTLLDSDAPPPAAAVGPPPPVPAISAAEHARLRARSRALLEKVRREIVQLEGVFRRIDDVERRIRYSFDPVEQHLDDALQHEPPDAERIHAGLLAVDADIGVIKAGIREAYNIPCDDDGGGEPFTASPSQLSITPGTGTAVATKRTGEIRRSPQMSHLRLAVGGLEERLRGCALCLAAFPEGAVIKKRLLLHWWVAEGFRDMESCRNLRYVSFRGISRIESLPNSIGKLRALQVLDLRACHNLEELGQGITKLDRLEYLDLSECHLLVGVPKGLGQLTRLQILKGFVVANSNSRDFCHLNELTRLEKLRKLGIVIGKMAVPMEDEFLKLGEFKSVESLRISWGVLSSDKNNGVTEASPRHSVATMKYALPPNLKKLDLHCFPLADFSQWVRPMGVRKLYIRGGKLATLGDDEDEWEAEVLRLRFLRDLQCDHGRLQRLFRKLKPENTEIHECPNFIFGKDDTRESAETHAVTLAEVEETFACT